MSLRCHSATFGQRYPPGTECLPSWASFFLRASPLFLLQNAQVQLCGFFACSAQLHQTYLLKRGEKGGNEERKGQTSTG